MGDPRRVTQELVEIEYAPADPNRRVTQELVEIEYSPATPNRRITQLLVEVEYLAVPNEDQTQIRGWDQIQPWSITSDRLSQEVAGAGLRGGGPEGPLWVDVAIYPPPTVQGQALIADGTPQWTPTLTPTWLGEHTFDAGLVVSAAQAITMGDEAYIGCGPADVRIVFDAGNDISLMGGNVGIGTVTPDRLLHAEIADSATNSVTYAQRLGHVTSATAVAGFGTGIEFELEENDGSNRVAAIIEAKWSDAGEGANADGYLDFLAMSDDGAAASRMVVGYNTFVGIGTLVPTLPLQVAGNSTPDTEPVALAISDPSDMTERITLGWNIANHYGSIQAIDSGVAVKNLILQSIGGSVGIRTTAPDRLFHAEVSDAVTNSVTYAQRLSHITSGTAAALFGVGLEMELEDAGGNNRVASMYDTVWADPGAASYLSLLRWQNTHIGNQGGYGGYGSAKAVAGGAVTILPHGAKDAASGMTMFYRVLESAGGTSGGSATVDNTSSVDLYDDGTDVLTLAVAADGSATLQRTAGAATFDVVYLIVWM